MKSLVVAIVVVAAACANQPSSHECANGIVCPEPLQCAAVQQVCISNLCGNGIVDTGEVCDDGNITDGDGCSADCKSKEACGDGVVNTEAGEVCDDNNTVSGDGCSADCKSLETCGNGIVDTAKGEICDDGNTHAGTCGDAKPCDTTSDCTVGSCTPDGCSGDCKSNETCGNGIKDLGEVCDDGGAAGGCEDNCLVGVGCGNGMLDNTEECDDGNLTDTDDCSMNCKINVCGDGIVDATGVTHHETCDPGTNGVPKQTATCNIDCTTPSCGDGKVNVLFLPDGTHGEQCDLGMTGVTNNNGNDKACTAACQVNVCGDGHQGPGEACDHGTNNGALGDTCDTQCKLVGCGNGLLEPGEQCDPHSGFIDPPDNTQSATCDSDCTIAYCGDTQMNSAALEVCDQGSALNGTPCPWALATSTCSRCAIDCRTLNPTKQAPFCGDGNRDIGHEACDQGTANGTPCPYGTSCQRCNSTCSLLATLTGPSCGDNSVDATDNEQCDGTMIPKTCLQLGYASGTPTCFAPGTPNQCHFNVAPCVPTCNNGTLESPEQCDGANLNNETCVTLGYGQGTLACDNTTCRYDLTGCGSKCPDGIVEGNEQCDGSDLNGITCATLGYGGGGNPTCNADCTLNSLNCSCGDHICGTGETHANCPGDCLCGNSVCDAGETHANCPVDCICGNGVCDLGMGENTGNCPGDCPCNGDMICQANEDATWCSDCP